MYEFSHSIPLKNREGSMSTLAIRKGGVLSCWGHYEHVAFSKRDAPVPMAADMCLGGIDFFLLLLQSYFQGDSMTACVYALVASCLTGELVVWTAYIDICPALGTVMQEQKRAVEFGKGM